ncbi:MAG: hypothetical protein ACE5NN_01845 [Candidatus Bathyarchaeia archaeon]
MNPEFQQIYIRRELHMKVKALAALNDVKICDLASEIIKDFLQDKEKTNEMIKRLKHK